MAAVIVVAMVLAWATATMMIRVIVGRMNQTGALAGVVDMVTAPAMGRALGVVLAVDEL